ncbi:MAG TPA: hypothetical protein VMU81_30355 [Acetobacteraceae bacterium]|jgi:hypothetical protein|nr:hypothetical protein [Acetobacteraceae bacterium]
MNHGGFGVTPVMINRGLRAPADLVEWTLGHQMRAASEVGQRGPAGHFDDG